MYALILVVLMGDGYELPQDVPVAVPPREIQRNPLFYRFRRVWEPVYRLVARETEENRTTALFSLSGVSVSRDHYLGNSFSSSLMVEAGIGLPKVAAILTWHLFEGIGIEMGFDLIQFKVMGALTYRP